MRPFQTNAPVQHLLDALAEAVRCSAPLEVQFALLTMNVDKTNSPREHLPFHRTGLLSSDTQTRCLDNGARLAPRYMIRRSH